MDFSKMSGDETFVFVVCLIAGGVLWIHWYWQIFRTARFSSQFRDRASLFFVPVVCVAALFFLLKKYASHDVRDDPTYLTFYLLMGAAWVGTWRGLLPIFGLSARDDVIERKNPSAALAISGALIGITLCFAGGNIGDGPGWWVVVFAGLLSSATLFLLWFLLDRITHLADAVTIDRDPAAGMRLAGFFIAASLILGRAVAGNWISAQATVEDFVKFGWPVLLLLAIAVIIEKPIQAKTDRPFEGTLLIGFVPAIGYILFGWITIVTAGRWT